MYELESKKLPKLFELPSDTVAATLGTMVQETLNIAAVEIVERGQVVDSRPHPKTLVSSLMTRKAAVFAAAYFGSMIRTALALPFHARGVHYR